MFFDELTIGAARKSAVLKRAPIPETGWRPPTDFPALWRAPWLAVDVETFDPDLLAYGPGWARQRGHIVGVSLATEGWRAYYPVRHTVQTEYNLDPKTVFSWLKYVLETPTIPKIGANLIYDIGWLTEEDIFTQGDLYDVQFAEALLNESGKVGLDHLGEKYCQAGKEATLLYQWCAQCYGGKPNDKQRANIYRSPPSLVGPYAEMDAELPPRVLQQQWTKLEEENLLDLFRLENDLIYPLIQMRMQGVHINIPYAEQLYEEFGVELSQLKDKMHAEYGVRANVYSARDLAKLFRSVGVDFPETENGNPSFRKEFLEGVEHPVGELVREIRKFEMLRGTFIKSYLLESNVKGKVYCQFHPLRGDDGGTRSGRFASSDPNLQNIPVRTEEGKKIRACFDPDPNHLCWEKDDYSQIEYRFLAHFANGPGSNELRQKYNEDPETDYHDNTYYKLCPLMGWNPDDDKTAKLYRRPVKNINFGLIYGMGKPKLKRSLMLYFQGRASDKEVEELFKAYHQANPYVKPTMDATSAEAAVFGYITTILGRRSRFDLWQPANAQGDDKKMALPYNAAIRMWGNNIQRAFLHKAINRRLQGSAADIMKVAMWRCWKDGVYNVTGYPKLTVHDELDYSVIDDSPQQREAYEYMRYVMAQAIPISVPVTVESKRATNWGTTEED